MIGWIMDVVLCLLLLTALAGGYVLNRRLLAIRQERGQMEAMIRSLTATVDQAEKSIHALRVAAQEAESSLNEKVRQGRALADELVIITQAGEDLANRLEAGLSGAAAARAKPEVTTGNTTAKTAPRLRALDGLR